MKHQSILARLSGAGAAMLFGVGAWFPGCSVAQPLTDNWQFRGSLYAYLPTIGGTTNFPAGTGSSISVDGGDIINALKFAFFGTLEAQKGRWGVYTDVTYLDAGASKSGTRDLEIGGIGLPAAITADAHLDVKVWVWTLVGNYRVIGTPEQTFDVFGGARVLGVKERLDWAFSADVGPFVGPGRQGSSEVTLNNLDGVVGVKGQLNFGAGREWFVPYYVDVGTGESDLTWQAQSGIGYAFKWGEITATWRYLDYHFKSGRQLEDLHSSGPQIGVAFRW